jgi:hypothetical protein
MVFHGGKSIHGENFYESNKMWYMYDNLPNKENLYGKGFTMYGKIKNSLYKELPENIPTLIENKFFDKIIYGSIWRCQDYLNLVIKKYNKEDIIFIDGEDEQDRINFNLIGLGKYFKREYNNKINGVYPVSFAIPEELVLNDLTTKTKDISDIIPNFNKNYTFNNESDYYKEYGNSFYAHTSKKGGWDCLRHYEIMMNGCVPIFEDLENCPINTLTTLPKKELIKFKEEKIYSLDLNSFILNYTKENLTTKKLINYLL